MMQRDSSNEKEKTVKLEISSTIENLRLLSQKYGLTNFLENLKSKIDDNLKLRCDDVK